MRDDLNLLSVSNTVARVYFGYRSSFSFTGRRG